MKRKILNIGSLNMDMVIGMQYMPLEGETVLGDSLTYIPGGKGANQACASARLGGDVVMLGCVGEDSMGEALVESLRECGADVSRIRTVWEVPTGTAVIYVNARGDNSIVVVGGANHFCTVDYLQEHDNLFQEADYIMLQMEIPYDAVFYAIRRAGELKKTVILNPAPAPDGLPEEIWEKIDYITPNETELLKLSGQTQMSMEAIHKGADLLLDRGVKHVLVTLGDKGVFYKDRGEEWFCPTRTVTAVDTTAAGDCFNGAFVTALSEGIPVRQAAAFANAAASIAVTRRGAQKSIPLRSEVDALNYGL